MDILAWVFQGTSFALPRTISVVDVPQQTFAQGNGSCGIAAHNFIHRHALSCTDRDTYQEHAQFKDRIHISQDKLIAARQSHNAPLSSSTNFFYIYWLFYVKATSTHSSAYRRHDSEISPTLLHYDRLFSYAPSSTIQNTRQCTIHCATPTAYDIL